MYDLIVIGGGPAGAAAAITAVRAGARVLLLERGQFPRHRVCGEFVSAESLGLLETLLASPQKPLLDRSVKIAESRIFLDGRVLRTRIDPPAASIARFDLDDALWRSAATAGVDVIDRCVVQGITGAGAFRVVGGSQTFDARVVVNASGRWSNLQRQNLAVREKWLGVKAHFDEASPAASVDLYFFDGGYCGVQPVGLATDSCAPGRINVAAMVRAEIASTLPEVLAKHPALFERSRHWTPRFEPVTTSPLIFRQPEPVREAVLLAGDAAGFVDPFVGDGISLALRSGALAAECLSGFFRQEISLATATVDYKVAYNQRLAPVFRASSQIRRMLRLPRRLRKPLLYVLENVPAAAELLVSKTRWSA